jgi:hypothetical protein
LFVTVALRPVTEMQYSDQFRRQLGWRGSKIHHELADWVAAAALQM